MIPKLRLTISIAISLFSRVYRKTFNHSWNIQSNVSWVIFQASISSQFHCIFAAHQSHGITILAKMVIMWWISRSLQVGGAGPHKHFGTSCFCQLASGGKKRRTPREQHNPWLFGGQCKAIQTQMSCPSSCYWCWATQATIERNGAATKTPVVHLNVHLPMPEY